MIIRIDEYTLNVSGIIIIDMGNGMYKPLSIRDKLTIVHLNAVLEFLKDERKNFLILAEQAVRSLLDELNIKYDE